MQCGSRTINGISIKVELSTGSELRTALERLVQYTNIH